MKNDKYETEKKEIPDPEKKIKKTWLLKRFMPYMGSKKILIPLSFVLSGASAVFNILPFIFVWIIVRKILIDPSNANIANVGTYAWMALGSAIIALALYFAALLSSHLAAFRVEIGLQKIGMEKILSMPPGFFYKNSSGRIRKIINDGASTTHTFLAHQLPDMAGSIITPFFLIFLLFFIDWRMGIVSLIPIIIGFIIMSKAMTKKGRMFQQKYMDSLEEMSSESVEYIRGIPVVKTFGQSVFSFKRFYDSIIRYRDMVYAYTLSWRTPMSFYTAFMEISALFLLPAAILLVGRTDNIPLVLADFIFYILITPLFSLILMRSVYFKQNMTIAEQAIDRIDNLLDYPEMEYKNEKCVLKNYDIEFKNVVFSYDANDKPAIEAISFKLNEGETVALVGASGSGKTTIARLAARFWDIDSGEILIGGINIKDFPKDQLMQTISFVFQNMQLMKGTLRDNIVFGKRNVHEKDIETAVELSQSKEIIDRLADGLETVIGSKGTYLSGGEQQRIALARAILKNAPIVLLDEATAFADPENEHLIQKALKQVSRNKTTLIIAHRLTSVVGADKIIVMDAGRIVESGTHEELLKMNGLYKNMWEEYQNALSWKIDMKTADTKQNNKNGVAEV